MRRGSGTETAKPGLAMLLKGTPEPGWLKLGTGIKKTKPATIIFLAFQLRIKSVTTVVIMKKPLNRGCKPLVPSSNRHWKARDRSRNPMPIFWIVFRDERMISQGLVDSCPLGRLQTLHKKSSAIAELAPVSGGPGKSRCETALHPRFRALTPWFSGHVSSS